MQEIAQAVREGANAYLYRQFSVVGLLILIITVVLFSAPRRRGLPEAFCGAGPGLFRRLDLLRHGRLRRHAAGHGGQSPRGRGRQDQLRPALQLGYRTGTITGMLTDGLGLLGGSMIFLTFGEHLRSPAGLRLRGTLLALFMRVGGGIFTKAADVGADLVGKLEEGIPEDDPRIVPPSPITSATTSATALHGCRYFQELRSHDRRGHDPGIASFGHKGVIFPLLVRAIGVVASIISTYSVRAGDKGSRGRRHEERQPRLRHRLVPEHPRLHPLGARIPELQHHRDARRQGGALHPSLSAGRRRVPG